jgi:NAD(P)-dependent dehydrogenase (short-subunit alcohol dehydrogenase family)
MVSIRALECLVTVTEQSSLTRAAAILHTSQPALSHQIAAIERELGTPVIERLPTGDQAVLAGRRTAAGAGGSFVFFSGVAAAKIAVGTMGVAITNAAAGTLVRSLALELGPLRVNAISPGVIDTGAWDAFGEQGKADYFADISARNPARRIGTTQDITQAVLFALTNTFLTGQTLHVDGGEPLT